MSADIAIFRVITGPLQDLQNIATVNDLYAPPRDFRGLSKTIFGVAYAGKDFKLNECKSQANRNELDSEMQKRFDAAASEGLTIYEFVRDRYQEDILPKQIGKDPALEPKSKEVGKPNPPRSESDT